MNIIEYRGTTTVNGMKIEISVTIEKLSDENIAEAKAIVERVLEEIQPTAAPPRQSYYLEESMYGLRRVYEDGTKGLDYEASKRD